MAVLVDYADAPICCSRVRFPMVSLEFFS